ncbi:E3 ubiquitin/ISG15 ligase TRIM25-like [Sphaeramia orbicularis]|uniref:E3 ubiquitin/ISG15 ligase TRIM25-like n=1 Tax=Sphaeramia orbicularis TaxID=375764 RepID=A0A672YGZ9_9TELE|nr:E3 ubiquitin/ISG15 ligase TRIM25-like [Sphaeramia orbicularis]
MAHQQNQEKLMCSVCLDLFKDPVTIPCGHSYCLPCISHFWDEEDQRRHSCPQCRQSFTPRPVLMKNIILAELIDDLKGAAAPDHCYAGPENVACDLCTGRKLKASKFCFKCMVSYCEQHIQPHYDDDQLKKHKLSDIQNTVCFRHHEVMKIFCRTDHQCICHLCSVDEHDGHDTVSAAIARAEGQEELGISRQNILKRIQEREKYVMAIQQGVNAINHTANQTVKECENMLAVLKCLIQKKSTEVKKQVGSQAEAEVMWLTEVQKKIQEEIDELKCKDTELKQFSQTEDHIHFLNNYSSRSCVGESTDLPSVNFSKTLSYLNYVKAAVSESTNKMKVVLDEELNKLSSSVAKVRVSLLQNNLQTGPELQRHFCNITLDPNTTHKRLFLSNEGKKVTITDQDQSYSSHPSRFVECQQVLSRDGLTGCHHWAVEWSGTVSIAVTYNGISRTGTLKECAFGWNNKSWALRCDSSHYEFWHNNISIPISGPLSSRVGVYLDYKAGILSFYSISETMTLLHTVKTKFTQPLYPGFWLPGFTGDSIQLLELLA